MCSVKEFNTYIYAQSVLSWDMILPYEIIWNQGELACSDNMIKEFAKGFKVMRALQLPESVWFDHTELGTFFNPLKMKTLYISHVK